MVEEPDNIVLRYLRRLDGRMDELQADLRDVKMRLGSLEEQSVLLRSEVGGIRADIVHIHHRLDRMDDRIKRIEHRLNLIEA